MKNVITFSLIKVAPDKNQVIVLGAAALSVMASVLMNGALKNRR